jgi:hypothetical protein
MARLVDGGDVYVIADDRVALLSDLRPVSLGQTHALEDARRLIVEAEPDALISRRSLPFVTTSPAMQVEQTVGPFLDPSGRRIWIDVFRPRRFVRFVRAPGGQPFLMLEIPAPAPVVPGPAITVRIPAGSVWLASRLLAGAAPANGYTGVRITSGTLRFSQPISTLGAEIVVPATVIVSLDLDLEQPTPVAGNGPGGDVRAAQIAVPARVRFTITAANAQLETTDRARIQAYGFTTDLVFRADPVRYLADQRLLAVPFDAQTTPFAVNQVQSTLFTPQSSAPISSAAWGLPVVEVDPARLGQASGVGGLLLWLDTGLSATWLGQPQLVDLEACLLAVDAQHLSVTADLAAGEHVQQEPTIASGGHDRVELRWAPTFPITFVSYSGGVDGVLTRAELKATLDKPVDLRGQREPVNAASILVAFIAEATGNLLLIDGNLDAPSGAGRGTAFALVNAVLRTSYPTDIFTLGAYDGSSMPNGRIVLGFNLRAIVPTLPDPYAASYSSLPALLDQQIGRLESVETWQPAVTSFDFVLPQPAQTHFGTAAAPATPTDGATDQAALMVRGGHDLWPNAIKAIDGALAFERQHGLIMLDVSTNIDQFGIGLQAFAEGRPTVDISQLSLRLSGREFVLLTLPAVQWEPVETIADPDPTFPPRLSFANSGVPSLIGMPTVNLVPIEPGLALQRLIENFAGPTPMPVDTRFTLPFGIIAQAELRQPDVNDSRGATVTMNRPHGGALQGAHQLRIDAVDKSLPTGESPSLPGFTAQLPVGNPGQRSVLGDSVTEIFNTYLGASGARPLVPVTRMDLSGYGESLFSDWHNPYHDPTRDAVAVVQARFDVLIGRTAYEVIQVRSVLFKYAVEVVRTITIERRNNAVVTRHDSGWRAISDGTYQFPSVTPIITHPGVVRRITHVSNIRETGQVVTVDGTEMAAVYFDGDLEIDGAPDLVPVKDQFGFVQITAGALIGPTTYANLLTTHGPLGGPVAANINIGGGPQVFQVQRVDVAAAAGVAGPEFAVAAWGSPVFPGGGQWSALRVEGPDAAPHAVPKDRGVPLIRAGAAGASPPLSSPYRFAEPADLTQPANPATDYGILHATGTQRVFFARPKIEATDPTRITSTQVPSIADPYSLAGALDVFPELNSTLPFPSATWALHVNPQGQYRLELPSNTFPVTVGRRTLRQAGSVKGDVDYGTAQVTYEVDTTQPVPWRFRLDSVAKIMNSSVMGDVIRLEANIVASAGASTAFEHPKVLMGGSLGFVQDLLTILADLGISGLMQAEMTNEWSLKVAETIPFVDATGKPFQIPPLVPLPDIKFDDTGIKVEEKILPSNDEATFEMGGQPMFAIKSIPGLYVVAIIKFQIKLSTKDGTSFSLLLGVGLAFDIDAGIVSLKGLLAITFFGVIGDNTLGVGCGFLLKLSAAIEPIISIELSLEGKLALIWACRGTPNETEFGAAKLTFGVEITVCLVFSISFEIETTVHETIHGPGEPACALPDVI